jgi:hypothetical protein
MLPHAEISKIEIGHHNDATFDARNVEDSRNRKQEMSRPRQSPRFINLIERSLSRQTPSAGMLKLASGEKSTPSS